MSWNRNSKLANSGVLMLPHVEAGCSFTNGGCGAKNTTEHASEEVDSTTESVCQLLKPGNTDNLNTERAFRDPEASPRQLRDLQPEDSGKEHATDDKLKSLQVDQLLEELEQELDKLKDLPGTESSNDADDTKGANREAHNRYPGKLSIEDTCEPSSTSDVVHSSQELTKMGLKESLMPSSTSDVVQLPQNVPTFRFKAVNTETGEQVVTTSKDILTDGSLLKEYEDEAYKDEEYKDEEYEDEDKEEEEEDVFVKPPNWLDPQLLRSVPALKNATNPSEPYFPNTFFGKLHQNSPLAYTGREEVPISKQDKGSIPSGEEEFFQVGEQEQVEKPLEEASEEALEKRNMNEVKACEKLKETNDISPFKVHQDAPGTKEVVITLDLETIQDSRSSLEVPHIQACASAVKPIFAKKKDCIPLHEKDSLSLHRKDSLPSNSKDSLSPTNKNFPSLQSKDFRPSQCRNTQSSHFLPSHSKDYLPSHSKDTPSSPNKNSSPSHSKDFLPPNKDSLPSQSKDTSPLPNKDPPPSHSRDSPLCYEDFQPSHSKDCAPSDDNGKISAPHSLPSHSQDSLPSQSKEILLPSHSKKHLHSHSNYSSPAEETSRVLNPLNEQKSETDKPKATHQKENKEQEETIELYDPEFPALNTPLPTKELNAGNLDMIRSMPTAMLNHMTKWLYSQSFKGNEYEQEAMEVLPEYTLIGYSDSENEPEEQEGSVSDPAENVDATIQDFQSLILNEAIPECCLTDSVFLVDKPKSAISRGFSLPLMPLEQICPVKDYLKIRVTHVYSPFQFWFNFVDRIYDTSALLEMQMEMCNFYNGSNPDYMKALPKCLIQAGFICAIQLKATWRRARISATPPPGCDSVSVYYLDYGYGVDVSASDLHYLPNTFGEKPALAVRGTLSYIHPLGPHWSPDSMEQFQRLIIDKEMFAHITELDLVERIVFLRISLNEEFLPSVNKMLVEANLAGRSQHYDVRQISNNFGQRHRYLRERLPSHEMLETRVFPVLGEEFEVAFDGIIYSPSFEQFKVPRLRKGYAALRKALVAWMPAYRQKMEHWAALYNEAKAKQRLSQREAREAWLLREEKEQLEKRNKCTAVLIERVEVLKASELQEDQNVKSVLPTEEEEEPLRATDDKEEPLRARYDKREASHAENMEDVD